MDLGTVLSVAQTLFDVLQCSQLREMCSILGYKSQLEELQGTVEVVRKVLHGAEAKPDLSEQEQLYIEELKDAVYDADDLLDEFLTLAEHKQKNLEKGGKVSKKVRLFFSRFHPLVAYNISQGVKEIRKKLDSIANNHNRFGFKLDSQAVRLRREETCSYVYAQDVIGREDDTEKIVGMLLDSNVQRDLSFLTIVGIGGLGKTTLAQLAYNDERVTKEFDLRLWACVSDEKYLDVKAVLGKILGSTTGEEHSGSSIEWLQDQLRQQVAGKKYLLVLDDVWNENRNEWLKLVNFLKGGPRGSWVVVTTRSKETARVVGDGPPYELKGLSIEDSWRLFERAAFGDAEGQANVTDFIEIGQQIVKKCANVPLAIRMVGSLLYGQERDIWVSFQSIGLAKVRQGRNSILPILKLSYHHLESRLKICFSYCALFPKDYEINKEMLISLWMAQGYIVPLDKGQSMEDAAEEYFSILLRRCFFQDVEKDELGDIISCKIHDLMHDIAQEVAGDEHYTTNSLTSKLDTKIRHFSLAQSECLERFPVTETKIRTFLRLSYCNVLHVDTILQKWVRLRALDLRGSGIKVLPDTIGKLLHLRYLNLSNNNYLEVLPKSFTKLINMQTLKLKSCSRLKELPNDLTKLVKLRLLDIYDCYGLTHMPSGMGKLSNLHSLSMFVAGEANPSSKQCLVDQLDDLKALVNLKGILEIRILIPQNAAYFEKNCRHEGGYMRSKQHLNVIKIVFEQKDLDERVDYEEALLEGLQPHPNLRGLVLMGYCGMRLPSWIKETNFGNNLVVISFGECDGLQYLSSLGKLPHLRRLHVRELMNLKYMENTSVSDLEASPFFPSLEKLELNDLPKLKGWWRDRQPSLQPSFSRLSKLFIWGCPDLTSIPLCPKVEHLTMRDFNEQLRVIMNMGQDPYSLTNLSTDDVRGLKSVMPMEAFHCLTQMDISYNTEIESLEGVGELFRCCSSSLQSLEISYCDKLSSLCRGVPWQFLCQGLRSLELNDLPKLVNLPQGMQFLNSLQSLVIRHCKALESLPEWMQKLTSLRRLEVGGCSLRLMQRCKRSTGEDWPYIQHIPHVIIIEG